MKSHTQSIWDSLLALREYIRDGIVRQMQGATSFGGDDMVPLKEAYLACERGRPFVSDDLYGAASSCVTVALNGLNGMLQEMRRAITIQNPADRARVLQAISDQARKATLDSYEAALLLLEPIIKRDEPLEVAVTNNFNGPNFGQINPVVVSHSEIDNSFNQRIDNSFNQRTDNEKTLAEAAAEIQKLLEQLEKTNPTATEADKITYVNIATKPDLKQRVIAALKEGSKTAIDEFIVDNKYLKVVKAVIQGWLLPNG